MSFENIIGYKNVRNRFDSFLSQLNDREKFAARGIAVPNGFLITGIEGLGKEFMAQEFAEATGRDCFVFSDKRDFSDEFSDMIDFLTGNTKEEENTEEEADTEETGQEKEAEAEAETEPRKMIIAFSDLGEICRQAPDHGRKLAAVMEQALEDFDVYFVGVADNTEGIPSCFAAPDLLEHVVRVLRPSFEAVTEIIKHLAGKKKLAFEIPTSDMAKMLHRETYACIESVLDEAAVKASYEGAPEKGGKLFISRDIFVGCVLSREYEDENAGHDHARNEADILRTAYHEAGHVVAGEFLQPGIIGYASVRLNGDGEYEGFVSRCNDWDDNSKNPAVLSLAAKAAVELKYGKDVRGSISDVSKAIDNVKYDVIDEGLEGLSLVSPYNDINKSSEHLKERQEEAIARLLEERQRTARCIVSEQQELLDAIASELAKKGCLLYSEIQKLVKKHMKRKDA